MTSPILPRPGAPSLCLHLVYTTVDGQLDAGDEAAVIRRQEQRRLRDLVHVTDAAERHGAASASP